MTALISIWRQHANGMEFGEFLASCVAEGEARVADEVLHPSDPQMLWLALVGASHSDLLRWARERFGIEA